MTQREDKIEWDIISIYSRRQALGDGLQKDVSKTAKEAGILFPVFITQAVYAEYVTVPEGVECQDEEGRLWDIVWMLSFAIRRSASGSAGLSFHLYVRNSNKGQPSRVTLSAVCGPLDFDDPQPAITIMLLGED